MRGRKSVRRAALVLLHALLLLQASECEPGELVASAAETHVYADGSAERRVLLDASPPGPELTLDESWSLEKGVSRKERSAAVGRSYGDVTTGEDNGGMTLEIKDYFFWREYVFSDRPEGLLEGGRSISGGLGYKLVMPGLLSRAPGAIRQEGGVAVYEFGGDGDGLEVQAVSWKVRWWAVLGASGGLSLVGALLLGGRAAWAVKGLLNWLWTGRWNREVDR